MTTLYVLLSLFVHMLLVKAKEEVGDLFLVHSCVVPESTKLNAFMLVCGQNTPKRNFKRLGHYEFLFRRWSA